MIMIRPSEKLKKYVKEYYKTATIFCREVHIDPALWSKMLSHKRVATVREIMLLLEYTPISFYDAWDKVVEYGGKELIQPWDIVEKI